MIEKPVVHTFEGKEEGPTLLIFGGIHGDEVCGPEALIRIKREIEEGILTLARGTLILVPVANPQARKENKRFIEENLNRIFKTWEIADTYEKQLANLLTETVQRCDYLLDVHSMTAKSEPTVFIDFPTSENRALAAVLGMRYAILGWPELYEKHGGIIDSYDTTLYANSLGKHGVIVECGQHEDPKAIEVAYDAIISALKYVGILNGEVTPSPLTEVLMRELYIKKNVEDDFTKDWQHLDSFKEGEVLATTTDGPIVAAFDGVMLLPKRNHPVGTEWFYTGSIESVG